MEQVVCKKLMEILFITVTYILTLLKVCGGFNVSMIYLKKEIVAILMGHPLQILSAAHSDEDIEATIKANYSKRIS